MLRYSSPSAIAMGFSIALSVFASANAHAEEAHPCSRIANSTERLACFDEAFPPSPEDVEAREQAAREQFGLNEAELIKREPSRAHDETPRLIEARVTDLDYRRSGERLITLDNGQMWLETEVTRRVVLSEGDAVQVRRAVGGSYRLITPARAGLRVRRVK